MDFRQASLGDIDELIDAAETMYNESAFHSAHPLNREKMRYIIDGILTDQPENVFLEVCAEGSMIIGFIAGEVVDEMWSDRKVASDHAFYVRKDWRRSGIATQLIMDFVNWAREHEAYIRMSVSAGINDEIGRDFMLKGGFEERGYIMGID